MVVASRQTSEEWVCKDMPPENGDPPLHDTGCEHDEPKLRRPTRVQSHSDLTLRVASLDLPDGDLPQDAGGIIHLSILKSLVGREVRGIVRDEISRAFAEHLEKVSRVERHQMGQECAEKLRPPQVLELHQDLDSLHSIDDAREVLPRGNTDADFVNNADFVMKSQQADLDVWQRASNEAAAHWLCLEGLIGLCPVLKCCGDCLSNLAIGVAHAPERTDILSRVADSSVFNAFMTVVILANCFWLAFSADQLVKDYLSGESLLSELEAIDWTFFFIYTCEFVVKFARHRQYYFYGAGCGYNLLDFSLLVLDVVSALLQTSSLGFLRTLRLTKTLRVLRVMTMVKSLRAILHSLVATAGTLFSSLLVLVVTMYMFALILVQGVAEYLDEQGGELSDAARLVLLEEHGSVGASMFTLLVCSNGGQDWHDSFVNLEPTGWFYQTLLVGCVLFTQIALLNIILGLFVEDAVKVLKSDKDAQAREHAEEKLKMKDDMMKLFDGIDLDREGSITQDEWDEAKRVGKVFNYLDMQGLKPSEVDHYWRMCKSCTRDGKVSLDSFVTGCIELNGPASCFEMLEVRTAVKDLGKNIRRHNSLLAAQLPPRSSGAQM